MKRSSIPLMVGTAGAVFAGTLAAILGWSGIASATPGFQFNSEPLSRVLFEKIRLDTGDHGRHGRHDRHGHKDHGKHDGRKGRDHDDDDDETSDFRVKVKVNAPTDVHLTRNRVPPGGHSGWHTHPGPSIVSVKTGVATVYDGDDPSCTPKTYPAGTGFIDEGGDHVHMVRNEGAVELEVIAFQMVPAGAERRIDAPAPAFCGF